ncbi:ubiquinone anaerobic biosynthesis protein UbiV [Roseinatronobacter bogoriensis]|uniref:Ubiquinone biosynthesis protein UbiV n=1 Tax=Roseinatronobacter bogoriensis subsp. barguzinensis TaxID=441209 RepID=A0A2K8KE98_9RHOB|nr:MULTISPECIES: U32 family peptidase [Rhodobaca]ATX67751.1 U32 family peptidase [Rhodobaca barguzinensis]MBB4208303.1 collagenase-like PrtC family protease [Rhodobaca bogoriensis DSM 18756]TDW38944.1 collagenase-like PrtC family protease [Rhodobaca barguzinensis]TDY68873.1 collagenase-like PrtC family protease [Rhodobaca bogoriensis DSM 18756]
MDLTVAPNPFFWNAEAVRCFYAGLADAPVARVVLGELVCSKRLPFWQDEIPQAIAALQAGGKEVALTSLALITLKRERKLTADLLGMGLPVEVNDLSALHHIPEDVPFWVGPLVNVYNEGTLRWLARRGATRICLPPELPMASIAVLAQVAQAEGVALEVWGHGRLPLAISGRCYHARLHERAKDSCQFVCDQDPDGRDVDTLEGQSFLAVNGVQTLSQAYACMADHAARLQQMGISALRLQPQSMGFDAICADYAQLLAGDMTSAALISKLSAAHPDMQFCDGFGRDGAGASWGAKPVLA